MKKFIISSLPRTGSEALVNSLSRSGINVAPGEPFWTGNRKESNVNRHNHVEFSKKILGAYDGFKIIAGHTTQLLELCEKNNAKLILLRRNNFLSFFASYMGLMTGHGGKDSSNYESWTSSGKYMLYKEMPFEEHIIDKFLYHNYLIDNIYPNHENYLTTINYEDPTPGLSVLEKHFNCEINLNIKPNQPLSKYFINHEEFKDSIEKKLKDLSYAD